MLKAKRGTRTEEITGAYVALYRSLQHLVQLQALPAVPLQDGVAALSVGMIEGIPCLDLNYQEDSTSEVDMNVVMTGSGTLVEIQGTAEQQPFTQESLLQMLDLARRGIAQLITEQRRVLGL